MSRGKQCSYFNYRPAKKFWKDNVSSHVCLCVHREGIPCDRYPSCIGPHCTGPPGSGPSCRHGTWGPSMPLLVTTGGHHWRPVQTSSLEDPPPSTDIWWLPKHVGWQAHILLESMFSYFCGAFDNRIWDSFGNICPWTFHCLHTYLFMPNDPESHRQCYICLVIFTTVGHPCKVILSVFIISAPKRSVCHPFCPRAGGGVGVSQHAMGRGCLPLGVGEGLPLGPGVVCLWVWGVYIPLDTPPPLGPEADIPPRPRGRHPPDPEADTPWADTPQADTTLWAATPMDRYPPPSDDH